MANRPVEIARFLNSAEATLFRGILDAEGIRAGLFGDAMAGWFWHWMPAIRGVRLVVGEDAADRALEVLRSQEPIDETQNIDFGDSSGGAGGEGREYGVPSELTRAWRSAVIGSLCLPPLLTAYSTWLLVRHKRVFDRRRNWRVVAAWILNALVVSVMLFVVIAALIPPARSI